MSRGIAAWSSTANRKEAANSAPVRCIDVISLEQSRDSVEARRGTSRDLRFSLQNQCVLLEVFRQIIMGLAASMQGYFSAEVWMRTKRIKGRCHRIAKRAGLPSKDRKAGIRICVRASDSLHAGFSCCCGINLLKGNSNCALKILVRFRQQ